MNTLIDLFIGTGLNLYLLNLAVHITLAGCLCLVSIRLIRSGSAPMRYGVLLAGLIVVLVAPAITWTAGRTGLGFIRLSGPEPAGQPSPPVVVPPSLPQPDPAPEGISFENSFLPAPDEHPGTMVAEESPALLPAKPGIPWQKTAGLLLTGIWILGALTGILKIAHGFILTRKLSDSLKAPRDRRLAQAAEKAGHILGLARPVTVSVSPLVPAPLSLGMVRPLIVFPEALEHELDVDEIEGIILHETAHVAHRDHAVGFMQRVAIAFFWWNPLVRKICERLSEVREEVCDNYVIQVQGSGERLARCLVDIAERTTVFSRLPAAIGLVHPRNGFENRVKGLLKKERNTMTRMNVIAVVIALAFTLGVIGIMSGCTVLGEEEKQKDGEGVHMVRDFLGKYENSLHNTDVIIGKVESIGEVVYDYPALGKKPFQEITYQIKESLQGVDKKHVGRSVTISHTITPIFRSTSEKGSFPKSKFREGAELIVFGRIYGPFIPGYPHHYALYPDSVLPATKGNIRTTQDALAKAKKEYAAKQKREEEETQKDLAQRRKTGDLRSDELEINDPLAWKLRRAWGIVVGRVTKVREDKNINYGIVKGAKKRIPIASFSVIKVLKGFKVDYMEIELPPFMNPSSLRRIPQNQPLIVLIDLTYIIQDGRHEVWRVMPVGKTWQAGILPATKENLAEVKKFLSTIVKTPPAHSKAKKEYSNMNGGYTVDYPQNIKAVTDKGLPAEKTSENVIFLALEKGKVPVMRIENIVAGDVDMSDIDSVRLLIDQLKDGKTGNTLDSVAKNAKITQTQLSGKKYYGWNREDGWIMYFINKPGKGFNTVMAVSVNMGFPEEIKSLLSTFKVRGAGVGIEVPSTDIEKTKYKFKASPGNRSREARVLVPMIKKGMTKDQVQELLGEPDKLKSRTTDNTWLYTVFYSQFIAVTFEEGKVVKIKAVGIAVPSDNISWGEPVNGLRLSVSLPRKTWTEGEQLQIKVFLANAGSQPVHVNTQEVVPGFRGTLIDTTGKAYGLVITKPDGTRVWPGHFRKVPGNGTLTLPLKVHSIHGLKNPDQHQLAGLPAGSFSLSVSYESNSVSYWDSKKGAMVKLPSAWTGKLSSDRVRLEVGTAPRKGVSWGNVSNGLQVGLSARAQHELGKPMRFSLEIKNSSGRSLHLRNIGHVSGWQFLFVPQKGGVPWIAEYRARGERVDRTVRKAGSEGITFTVGGALWRFRDTRNNTEHPVAPVKELPLGKYVVTAMYDYRIPLEIRKGEVPPCWLGKVSSGSFVIEVLRGAAGSTRTPSHDISPAEPDRLPVPVKHMAEQHPALIRVKYLNDDWKWDVFSFKDAKGRQAVMEWLKKAENGPVSERAKKHKFDSTGMIELFAQINDNKPAREILLFENGGFVNGRAVTKAQFVELRSIAETFAAEDGDKEKADEAMLQYLPDFYIRPQEYKADPYIKAAVSLQAMGRKKAQVFLLDLTKDREHGRKVILLCRMLFVKKKGSPFQRPMIGGASFLGGTDYTDWPLEPITIVNGIPFLITQGYSLAGKAESAESYVNYCIKNCAWNSFQYRILSQDVKAQALKKLLASAKWKKPLTGRERKFLSAQLGDEIKVSSFEIKIASVCIGMTKNEVEKILGRPDDIHTPENHPGTWTKGTSEVWAYGTTGHNTYASKGAVYFDNEKKVQYVFGKIGKNGIIKSGEKIEGKDINRLHTHGSGSPVESAVNKFCAKRLKEIEKAEKVKQPNAKVSTDLPKRIQSKELARFFPAHEFYKVNWSTEWNTQTVSKDGRIRSSGGASGGYYTIGVNKSTLNIYEITKPQKLVLFLQRERIAVSASSLKELFSTCCFGQKLSDTLMKTRKDSQDIIIEVRCRAGCHRDTYTFSLDEKGFVKDLKIVHEGKGINRIDKDDPVIHK